MVFEFFGSVRFRLVRSKRFVSRSARVLSLRMNRGFLIRAAAFCSTAGGTPAAHRPTGILGTGDVLKETRRFSKADVAQFAEVSGDRNPVHFDPDFARSAAGFSGGSIVHGMLVASLFPSIIASHFPGAIYVSQTLQFKLPVYIEDEVVAKVQALSLREHKKRFIVKFTTKCFTNMEQLVIDGEATAILPTLAHSR